MTPTRPLHVHPQLLRQPFIQNLHDAARDGDLYFNEHTLRARFTRDITEAKANSRIDETQRQRLLGLLDESVGELPLRVDKLIMDDGSATCAELASAWMISDPALPDGPVYLHTLLNGLESFDDRKRLLDVLRHRFAAVLDAGTALDAERVGAALFEQRMLTILDQQAGHLQTLTAQMQGIPELYKTVGQALQEQLHSRLANAGPDVFTHLLQIVRADESTPGVANPNRVVMSMTLAEAALHEFIDKPLAPGMARQFLDERGTLLTTVQALPYVQSLAAVRGAVPEVYERLLGAFWTTATGAAGTARAMAAQTLAESYRHALLTSREAHTLTLHEFRILRTLLPLPEPDTVAQPVIVSRISLAASIGNEVKLAGIFLIEFPFGQLPGIYLYSSRTGISRLTNRQALITHFTTDGGRAHLEAHTSLEDRALVNAGALMLRLDEIEQSLFLGHIDSVIAVQRRNLRYVLDLQPLAHEQAAARIDDALDIRGLIDPRLLNLGGTGRWLAGGGNFASSTRDIPVLPTPASTVLPAPVVKRGESWVRSIQTLERFVDELGSARPDIAECAARVLDGYLAVLGEPGLKAHTLWVQSAEGAFVGLTELFLRRASGYSADLIMDRSLIYDGSPDPQWATLVSHLPASLLNSMFDRALPDFARTYERQVREFYSLSLRLPDRLLRPRMLSCRFREETLRLELVIEHRIQHLNQSAIEMIWQVMDRPLDSLRRVWGDGAVEVSSVQLSYGRAKSVMAMTNVFVLHRPRQPGSYLFWSVFNGFQVYESLARLEAFLRGELASHGRRQRWLDLFDESVREPLSLHLGQFGASLVKVRLQAIEGHFIEALQDAEIERHCQALTATYRRAVHLGVKTSLFSKLLSAAERIDKNREALDSLAIGLEKILVDTLIPSWLKDAPAEDMRAFIQAARQLYIIFDPKRSFLFDIPELREYARQALATRLKVDFPDLAVDPDAITTTLTFYTPAPVATGGTPSGIAAATRHISERLPDFAVNRLGAAQQGLLSVAIDNGDEQTRTVFTSTYVANLVRSLDVGGSYQRLLDEKLGEKTLDYARREAFYVEQHPPLERLAALESRIRGELSPRAYEFVEAVLYMPDGLARVALNATDVIFSPLQLLAEEGASPDPVTGVYIIAPQAAQPGPWILYALLSDAFVFKEYADQAGLLADIRTSPALQGFILKRLSARAQITYGHGGFTEPHLPFSTESSSDVPLRAPGPVAVQVTPCLGNALQVLFRGTLDTLKLLVKVSSVTTSDSDRQSALNVLSLLVTQGMAFLPGRLGVLVGLWQSESLLQTSIDAATRQDWGEVAATFSTALGTLVGAHPVLEEENIEILEIGEEPPPEELSSFPQFGWSKGVLTPQQVDRLRQFAVSDIALQNLVKDPLLNLYQGTHGAQRYAAVDGVVYRVRLGDDGWRIVGGEADGPPIRLNDQQQWVLNLPSGLKGGGGIVTRIQNAAAELQLRSLAIVEASGMQAIRRKYADRARLIAEAHACALTYLENCLGNLSDNTADGGIDLRTRGIVGDFFGVPEPDGLLYESIRTTTRAILDALTDDSLSPFTSERYVVVSNRIGHEGSTAFVFDNDRQKRIFLSERFFRVPHYRLRLRPVWEQAFNHGAHFRATTLLHELSHLVGDTEDIAYIEATAPFNDLLDDSTAYRTGIKTRLRNAQELTLSHLTDEEQLFRQLRDGIWGDLKRADGTAKQSVLALTGKATLAQARTEFFNDATMRSKIILNNADSVALLITLLGRQRFSD